MNTTNFKFNIGDTVKMKPIMLRAKKLNLNSNTIFIVIDMHTPDDGGNDYFLHNDSYKEIIVCGEDYLIPFKEINEVR